MSFPVIEAIDLKVSISTEYENINIINGVSLMVEPGESLAIKGASGSGKSTLLDLLAGLELPQAGYVKLEGNNLSNLSDDERARIRANTVGFVFQSFHLLKDLTAIENIALPLELFGRSKPYEIARFWLQKMGLENKANRYPPQLSGGEQQRIALCRAFALRPKVLFADEPTANLDKRTAKLVIDQLFKLQTENNISLVIATHDESLASLCDRTLYMQEGRLVEDEQEYVVY